MPNGIKFFALVCLWVSLSPSVGTASYLLPYGGRVKLNGTLSEPVLMAVPPKPKGFRWRPALGESLQFLVFENGYRLLQKKSREGLKGPFFGDWGKSVKSIHGWGDGDPFITNYIAHPMEGAVAGYLQIQNDPNGKDVEFGRSRKYWVSRLKALAWAAAYSTEFEIGPLSEASIGNVGMTKGTAGFVDLFVTPLGGFGMMILEDALHRYVLKKLEARNTNPWKIGLYRILFNPSRSFAGLMAWKLPFDFPPKSPKQALANKSKPSIYDIDAPPLKFDGWNHLAWPGQMPAQGPSIRPSCKSTCAPVIFDSKIQPAGQFEEIRPSEASSALDSSTNHG